MHSYRRRATDSSDHKILELRDQAVVGFGEPYIKPDVSKDNGDAS
jgi:hypothetical protein